MTPAEHTAPPSTSAAKPRLSRELVLTAALRLVDEEGLDALTMRRLGQALGRDPMGLYRYAENRAALLDGVTELVFEELDVFPDTADWQLHLRRIAHSLREVALRHPNVVPLLVTRPLSTPLGLRPRGTLRPLELILSLLIGRGLRQATPCTCTGPTTATFMATSSTSCKSSWWTPKRARLCCGWASTSSLPGNSRTSGTWPTSS